MNLRLLILLIVVFALMDPAQAQSRRMGGRFGGGRSGEPGRIDRGNVPNWELDPDLPRDCFAFARVKYRSWTQQRSMNWYTDFPDSDLNLSWRLHQLTALKVHPDGVIVEITDPQLFEYPFLFISGVGGLTFNDEEAEIMRRYLLGGGFLMVDDFHGRAEWQNFYKNIKKVFPDRDPIDLQIEHPIFHVIYDLKEMYQVPNIGIGTQYRGERTWERADWKEVHYAAIYDDKNRMVVFIGHNTDLGDGWEEEATDPFYFEMFSEPKAYPIGINVLVYAMTH